MARPQEINKEQILEHAAELFAESGLENFSMRKLALKCNVAASTIYLHFENKLDIAIALGSRFWNDCFSTLDISNSADFFHSMRIIYFHVLHHLEKFKTNWIQSFSQMNSGDKKQGRQVMEKFVGRILDNIEKALDKYSQSFDAKYYNQCDKKYLSRFIYENIMGMLMRYSNNYEQFEGVLKRILLG